jgi:nucleoside-diphosphate-sugar epimerase
LRHARAAPGTRKIVIINRDKHGGFASGGKGIGMKCVVTGAGGFIGSHLCERLLALGHQVTGIDAFIPYYPQSVKEANLATARHKPAYCLARVDLRTDELAEWLAGAEVIFHLAAMPGLAASWVDFDGYASCNIQATQRLLEAARRLSPRPHKLVYASTSSVYGRFASGDETLPTRPISPYGVTKLAAEHLCRAYAEVYDLDVVALRYFSVYGPRQRPDMAYHRFMKSLLRDEPITLYGDGLQVRGNTYVGDCVEATIKAVEAIPGEIYNVGGGEAVNMLDILAKLEALTGRRFTRKFETVRAGDQRHTFADTSKLRRHLGWEARTSLDEGLAKQWQWHQAELARTATPPHP